MEKKAYGLYKNVMLDDSEFKALQRRYSKDYGERINQLSLYMKSLNKTYADHFATILLWGENEAKKQTQGKAKNMIERACDYSEFKLPPSDLYSEQDAQRIANELITQKNKEAVLSAREELR